MNNFIEMIKLPDVNPITATLLIIAGLPLITGAFRSFSREGVRRSLWSFFGNVAFLLELILSIYLTKRIFFDHTDGLFEQIYNWIPAEVQTLLYGQDVLIYLVFVPLILALLSAVLHPFFSLLNHAILDPLVHLLYSLLSSGGQILRSITGALVQVPKAAFMILMVGMALNFLVYYYPSPVLSVWMNDSRLYQGLYQEVLCPVLNSNMAKQIPVIVNDSFAQTADMVNPDNRNRGQLPDISQAAQELMKGRVIEYFNGVTLDKAVESNAQIDETAIKLVGSETNSSRKAYLIYRWVAENIDYDNKKAARIGEDPSGIDSGSIVAFNTRTGVCFDYSSLYVSMCRAVGLKVRLITGLGYSGTAWGDHAWNQVYSPEEARWIDVDTTFGGNANYFDKQDFVADHRYAEVQGEW